MVLDGDRARGLDGGVRPASGAEAAIDGRAAGLAGMTRESLASISWRRALEVLLAGALLGSLALGGCASSAATRSSATPAAATPTATLAPTAASQALAKTATPSSAARQDAGAADARATQTIGPTSTPLPSPSAEHRSPQLGGTPLAEVRQLTVEEYPVVAKDVDSPTRLEYSKRIDPAILEKRKAWREAGLVARIPEANRTLGRFGYRLASKERPGCPVCVSYDLYQGDVPVESGLSAVWPVAVNASGTDFALVVEGNRGAFLVQKGTVSQWDQLRSAFTRPVFVGDDLVTVETDDHLHFAVKRGGKIVYTASLPGLRVDNPIKGLWSWQNHWVLEVDGQVLVDGKSLNQDLGYEKVFGWRLLGGQPLYFFVKAGRVGVSYAGKALPHQYDEVIHYRCCEPAAFNVAGNESMVWFHALRGETWHYVEAGAYDEQPATASEQVARPRTAVPTATLSSGRPTSALSEGVPALSQGTFEEAQKAVGVKLALPRYLPAGATREEPVRYCVAEGRGMVSVAYRVGLRYVAVEYIREPADRMVVRDGRPVRVGRFTAVLYTQPREPSDPLPPISEVSWRDGEVKVRVTGDLPPEELLKVAESLY